MKLIPLEEVKKLISDIYKYYADNHGVIRWLKRDIEYIDTIDPIEIIDEMIDELLPDSSFGTGIINSHKIDALQELKSRLTNNK